MDILRAMKLLCATLLVCTGAACIAFGGWTLDHPGKYIGFVLLVLGIPMMVRQWTGRSIISNFIATILWFFEPPPWVQATPPPQSSNSPAVRT
jgi:hypothetical protein